tara:strand:+ start:655 stop:1020 length:366 start_codon:yes stop_codon:yes gene_type:complete
MKNILVNKNGKVIDVREEQFPVHENFKWHSVDNDDVKVGWTYKDNTLVDAYAEWLKTDAGKRASMVESRQLEYGTIGDQLDAIYRDLKNGTSEYVNHISAVKSKYPKVEPVDPNEKDSILG